MSLLYPEVFWILTQKHCSLNPLDGVIFQSLCKTWHLYAEDIKLIVPERLTNIVTLNDVTV